MKRRGNREGSIYKRKDGRWCGAVFLGYDTEGKPIRKYLYGKTRQEITKKLTHILTQVNAGLISPEKYTLNDWLYIFFEYYKKPEVRLSTYERYKRFAENHLIPVLGSIPLEKLRPEVLQRFFVEKEKDGLAPNTIKFIYIILHSALDKALELGYVSRNVCDLISLPKRRQKEIRILSKEEMEHFLFCAKKHRLYPAFLLLATTGMRRGEVLGLRWQDVDLDKRTIVINQVLVSLIRGITFQEPKTKTSQRTIPLLPGVTEELKKWRKQWLEERIKLGPDWPQTDLVFPSKVHTPILPRNFNRVFHSICKDAGIENFTIHGLRHSFASYLLAQGENPKTVAEILGHSSVTITLDTYSKLLPGLKEQAIGKLQSFFEGMLE